MGKAAKKASNLNTLLPFKSALELETASRASWIAEPYLARGSLTELSGPAKAGGKTTWTLDVLRGLFQRGTFLDQKVAEGIKVAYLTEEHDPTFQRALTLAGIDQIPLDRLAILQWFDLKTPDWPQVAQKLEKDLVTLGSDLLVIDTFPQFAFHGDESENDANQALKAISPIHKIVGRGVAVLLIRHDRKAGGEVGRSARGSTAFGGAVDIMIQIRRKGKKSSPVRVLSALSRFQETPEEIIIEWTKNGYHRVTDGIATPSQHAVLAAFNGAPLTLAEVKINTGLKESTIYRALDELIQAGRVVATGTGKRGDPKKFSIIHGNRDPALEKALEGTEVDEDELV